jgi:hypothetical protein
MRSWLDAGAQRVLRRRHVRREAASENVSAAETNGSATAAKISLKEEARSALLREGLLLRQDKTPWEPTLRPTAPRRRQRTVSAPSVLDAPYDIVRAY